MSTKEQPPPVPKLMTLNKGLKLAEQWVNNMPGTAGNEAGDLEMEGRPAGLGLGAKVPRKSQLGYLSDPLERRLVKKLGVGRKKATDDEEQTVPAKNEIDSDDDDDENSDSRSNAFPKKRAGPQITAPQAKQKQKQKW